MKPPPIGDQDMGRGGERDREGREHRYRPLRGRKYLTQGHCRL